MSSSWARGLPGSLRLPGWERRDSLPSVLKVATGSVAASSPNTTPSVTYRSNSVLSYPWSSSRDLGSFAAQQNRNHRGPWRHLLSAERHPDTL